MAAEFEYKGTQGSRVRIQGNTRQQSSNTRENKTAEFEYKESQGSRVRIKGNIRQESLNTSEYTSLRLPEYTTNWFYILPPHRDFMLYCRCRLFPARVLPSPPLIKGIASRDAIEILRETSINSNCQVMYVQYGFVYLILTRPNLQCISRTSCLYLHLYLL